MYRVIGFVLAVILLCVVPALPTPQVQQPSQQTPQQIPPMNQPFPQQDNGPDIPAQMRRDMEKKANKQRQEQLKRDTDRLLKLSTELKQYVDKTNENVLSVEVIKKADEIEKLAHQVKVKMRGDY